MATEPSGNVDIVDTAVLDACVLFRSGVRDFLLWVAEAGAFSPIWSDAIHEEWMRSRRDQFGDAISRLNWARNEMEKAFPGANVAPDPDALSSIVLPDASDAHVVATAIAGKAGFIVTYNRRHFPARTLAPLGLRTETPDVLASLRSSPGGYYRRCETPSCKPQEATL